MKKLAALAASTVLIFFCVHSSFAQPSDDLKALSKEIEALKEGQRTMQQDLQEIKNLLRARTASAPSGDEDPRDLVLSIDGAPFKGEKNAKLTLIDFTDYQ